MVVEPIVGRQTGVEGWTVTWKGRGWWQSFDDYLELVREGCSIGRRRGLLVVPSVKYHLPSRAEESWKEGKDVETTRALMAAYRSSGGSGPLPIEGLLSHARRFGRWVDVPRSSIGSGTCRT